MRQGYTQGRGIVNKKTETVVILFALFGAVYFALRLPFLVYGGAPELRDDVLQPRNTATPLSAERAMTQQAFAMMFFTPTSTTEPSQPFFAFLIPNTGNTRTFTPTGTITNTPTITASPTRFIPPVQQTQTEQSGGGGPILPGLTRTPALNSTSTSPIFTATEIIGTPSQSITETSVSFTETSAPPATDTPKPVNTNKPPTHIPKPTNTPEPPTATSAPPTDIPTDVPTDPPVPTETPLTGGNSLPGDYSKSAPNFMQFIVIYLLGATFLGVVFRRQ